MADRDRDGVVAELVHTEHGRLKALVTADMQVARALHADHYQLITPGGASLSRSQYLDPIARGTFKYRRFEPEGEIRVRLLGPDAAVLRYRVAIDVDFPDGHDSGRFWHTDIYERRDGRWQALWSQATRIPTKTTRQ